MSHPSQRSIQISEKEILEWLSPEPNAQTSAPDLERLAHWLDSVFEIPGIRVRFGIDALLGLLPGIGDTASAIASIYILQAATTFRVSRITLARMTLNIVVDLLVGAVPFVGDLFDVYWKANKKNVELLRRHVTSNPKIDRKLKRSDGLFVAGMIAAIVVVLGASVTVAYWLLAWTIRLLLQR